MTLIAHGLGLTPVAHAGELSVDDLKTLAAAIAVQHDLDAAKFIKTIECESSFDPSKVGDNGTSFGLAQFHRPERDWGFTRKEAMQPLFAMTKMAEAWQDGKARAWTCFRMLK